MDLWVDWIGKTLLEMECQMVAAITQNGHKYMWKKRDK